ncbi:nuclear transport factor 2 family protein [Kaistia dalseonensis]|uniref:SnoaL-like domain-containing protein n=1 Tax=Kaistia dalseonensis TaxID=410840 RepID=A0ABU0HBH8_9HYPH|nr:nuclear transport factor 2 family protein [Kaistia dalseonensis]MCX5496513.1 nuclear transport factor 2 family protein [Kaistia dalseonensis]MDQ0439135.1 hypothetical protein [Kaistia dalseonensis]
MTVSLPAPIARYFAGKNARDYATAISAFVPSAVVRDEGHRHEGQAAIAAWMEETTVRYDDRADVTGFAAEAGGRIKVRASVSGNFPGSPIAIGFVFTLEGERIAELEIGS